MVTWISKVTISDKRNSIYHCKFEDVLCWLVPVIDYKSLVA